MGKSGGGCVGKSGSGWVNEWVEGREAGEGGRAGPIFPLTFFLVGKWKNQVGKFGENAL